MKKPKYKLDIVNYCENAAKNFSMNKLLTFTAVSLVLTVLLAVTTYKQHYVGTPFIFCILVLCIISAYTFMNLKAILIKIKKQ